MKKFRGIFLKNDQEIASLYEANQIGAAILGELEVIVEPGITSLELEEFACSKCTFYGVQAAFKG